jgi:uncharacterized protein (DUF305 family)
VTFAQTIAPHADQGVAMSELLLSSAGLDPDVRQLAAAVAATQRVEVEELRRWLLGHGQPVPTPSVTTSGADPGGGAQETASGAVDGIATSAQMRALGRADGELAERLYLELMTRHHQGAVRAAREEAARGQDATLVDFARQLAQTEEAQLQTLRRRSAATPPLVPGLTPPSGQVPPP